ncbi:EP1-like glycoprotein 2 [Carex rostrata]
MAFISSLAFVALLLCFPFSVNPQLYNYPIASAPASWKNSPSDLQPMVFYGEYANSLLLRLNVSHGLSFATGFYYLPPGNSFILSIYIISAFDEYYIPPQVIWSANRDRPVRENATLQLTSTDGLTLRDNDGSLVWSTSGLNRSVAGINITEAGNLVLFDINNSTIWQSIDHPTDCLVMGQTLEGGIRISANSSSTNLAESQFYLTLLADGLYGFLNSNPPQEYYYYRTTNEISNVISNRTVDKSMSIKFSNGSITMSSALLTYDIPIFHFSSANSIQYIRLESDGHLRLYDYDYDYCAFQWKMVADLLNLSNCDYPTVCGHYGICSNGQCTCPTGTLGNYFKPVDNRRAEIGCYAVTNITCQDENHHLLLNLTDVYYFNNINNVAFNATDEETCKKACLGDCKCKAALFQTTKGNSKYGKCLTLPDVFSFKNQPDGYSSAYIKVQGAPSSPSSSKVGLGAILGSTFGALLFMLTLISIYIVCLRRREEAEDDDIFEQLPGMPTRFTFEELRAATENFVKILGKGGFV